MSDEFDEIYKQDNPRHESSGWIQWKGTDVCMDLRCKCGLFSHIDCEFFYAFECPNCHTKYAVGQNIKLIELTPKQTTYMTQYHEFKTCELEMD